MLLLITMRKQSEEMLKGSIRAILTELLQSHLPDVSNHHEDGCFMRLYNRMTAQTFEPHATLSVSQCVCGFHAAICPFYFAEKRFEAAQARCRCASQTMLARQIYGYGGLQNTLTISSPKQSSRRRYWLQSIMKI